MNVSSDGFAVFWTSVWIFVHFPLRFILHYRDARGPFEWWRCVVAKFLTCLICAAGDVGRY